MKLFATLIFVFAALLVSPAMARLGETSDECNQRYGEQYTEAVGKGFWAAERKYEKNGVHVTIRFLRKGDGPLKAEFIEYKPVKLADDRLTEAKIKALMDNVSTEWVRLTTKVAPPVPVKPPPDPSKSLTTDKKTRVISIGETTGYDKKQAEKVAKERKELLDSIAARNRDMSALRAKIGKIAFGGGEAWASSRAFAIGNPSSLTLFSDAYMNAFDHQVELEKARKAKADATPLTGL